jgi:glycogen operon protein
VDDSFLLIVNAAQDGVEFTIPSSPSGKPWYQVIDTEKVKDPFVKVKAADKIIIGGRSLKLLSDAAAN